MSEILSKISSYNIFNYLFPGVVFSVLGESVTSFSFIQEELVVGLFYYYFIGLVISRVGSILIEPIMKKARFVEFSEYKDYIAASKKDGFIKTLSEVNNMYRTLCSLFFCLMVLKGVEFSYEKIGFFKVWGYEVIALVLFVVFCFSYKKQTEYISKRVSKAKESANNE